ncbi:hypothetical protein ACQY1Q_00420 [Tenacibaculum sp. TC6]|uniref:hypothetical protein n=1 Tax=Tenacibaculum sp. TC6 TaxID=3423223 RepID=UPI003D3661E2
MKTLKTIFVMIILFVFTTSCTDLSEDLKLHDKLKKEQVISTDTPTNTTFQDTGDGNDGNDGTGKG